MRLRNTETKTKTTVCYSAAFEHRAVEKVDSMDEPEIYNTLTGGIGEVFA